MTTMTATMMKRLTLAYALLIGGLPVLQGTAYVTGGWTESRILLAVFLLLPALAAWLVHKGMSRPGAILMLGVMSSGLIINSMLFEGVHPPEFAQQVWVSVLRVWILLLLVSNVVLGWSALRLLREVHAQASTDAGATGA